MVATKGFKFFKLPKILSLQLNRFTLDYTTFNRKKLNDRVTFPLILNMNPFLHEESLQDFSKTEELINDNDLIKVNPNVLKSNFKEEHQKELEKIKNSTSENF